MGLFGGGGLLGAIDDFLFGGSEYKEYAMQAYMASLAAINNAKAEADKALSEGKTKAQAYLDAIDTSRKSAKELYQEGREIAGMEAADKAGIAKKQAKAAASQAGASKLFSAIQGAQAATDAVQQGYDEAAQAGANMAQSQEEAQKSAEMAKASNQAGLESNMAQTQASTAMNAGNALANAAQGYGNQMAGGALQQAEGRKNRMSSLGTAFVGAAFR